MPKKPMTVTDAYNKAKTKGKTSARENVTRSGQGSGNTMSRASVGASRNAVTRTGQGSGNKGPKKNKSFLDRVGGIAKGVGRVGAAVAKDAANTVTNPFGAAKSTAKQIGKDVKNKNIAGLGLAAASMIPIPGAKGTAAALKAAGKAGKATKTLSQMADDVVKATAKKAAPATKKAAAKETPALAKKLDALSGQGGDAAGVAARTRAATPKVKKELARPTVPQVMPIKRVSRSATAAEKKILDKGKSVAAKPTVNLTGYKPPATKVKLNPWDKNIAMSKKYDLPTEVKPAPAPKKQGPKVDTTPKAGSVPKKKPAQPAATTAKAADVPRVAQAQAELTAARAELKAFKAAKGGKYKDAVGYKQLLDKVRAKEVKVSNATSRGAPRRQRGVTQKTMTDGPVKPGDAQRTYSGVGRSNTPRSGVTESPKPNKGQYEGDSLRGQARNDAASMSNRGLRGSSRATRDGRTAENKAKNVENIKIRENDRKVAKYNDMLAKAKASKKPKDIAAAKKYAEFWGLKGIKKLK